METSFASLGSADNKSCYVVTNLNLLLSPRCGETIFLIIKEQTLKLSACRKTGLGQIVGVDDIDYFFRSSSGFEFCID